jgi:hypothetical protein
MRAPLARESRSVFLGLAPLILLLMFSGPAAGQNPSRELTFQQRVEALRALERVTYTHQIGTTRPFEEAVPSALLERRVHTTLKQTAALERFWRTRVTEVMLRS